MPKIKRNGKIKNNIVTLNLRLPSDIISWLDSLIEKGIYSTRSEVIRDTTREFISNK